MPKKVKLEVNLLRLEDFKHKRIVRCNVCDLSYSVKDYDSLFKSQKLIYFNVPFFKKGKNNLCHTCLRKEVLKLNDGKPIIVFVKDKRDGVKFKCKFYPEEDGTDLGGIK